MSRTEELRFAFGTRRFLDRRSNDLGGVAEFGTETRRALLVWKPEVIGEIFRGDREMTLDGSDTLGPLVGDTSLLFANGPRHAAYRQVIGPRLRGRHLHGYEGLVAQAIQAAVDELTPDAVVPVAAWTRRLTLAIVSRIILGSVDDGVLRRFTTWVDGALGSRPRTLAYRYLRLHPSLPSPWRTFLRRRGRLDRELLYSAGNRDHSGPETLLDVLRSGSAPLGPITDGELRDQVVSLLFAGHETTASATAWTLFWLERDESVRRDIIGELTATTGSGAVAEQVPLLDAACREALRITPPAMVAGNRVLRGEREIAGRTMPAGTRITPCVYLTHRRSDRYPDPERFDPQRFLGRQPSAREFLPFGGGTRRCLGADLAALEMRMIVAAVLRQRDYLCVNPDTAVPHLRGPAMGPGEKLRMRVVGCPS